jgi:ubiquinone/menaquinone biosynthesis C-methylase UbiE
MADSKSAVLNSNPPHVRIIATNELVTGPPVAEMLRRSGLPGSSEAEALQIMDNACGGGIVTAELLKLAKEHPTIMNIKRVVASDIDDKMVSYVEERSKTFNWSNVEVMKIDQQSVPLADNTFSHVFNGFGIFFCADDGAAISETSRILKPGGIAGFTSWKKITWWQTLAMPALAAFIPDAPALPSPQTVFPARGWSDPDAIPARLEKGGFKDVNISEYSFTPDVPAEEFAEATAVLVQVITKRLWSEDDNKKYGDQIELALLRYLKENFPNGRWNGQMIALISIGRKV